LRRRARLRRTAAAARCRLGRCCRLERQQAQQRHRKAGRLVGGAAEFGLLMTFLGPSTDSVTMSDGEPALAVKDIVGIYAGEKRDGKYDPLTRRFPSNWESTPKTIVGLGKHTVHILKTAAASHLLGEFRENEKRASEFPVCPRAQ
jgi:hypothetical protein